MVVIVEEVLKPPSLLENSEHPERKFLNPRLFPVDDPSLRLLFLAGITPRLPAQMR